MKLTLNDQGYVVGFTSYAANYDELPGVEYTGEVPEDFAVSCRFYRYENGTLILDEAKQQEKAQKEAARIELAEITAWFNWYDNQCMQYSRSVRLGETFDGDIAELDEQAQAHQFKIREIRELLDS